MSWYFIWRLELFNMRLRENFFSSLHYLTYPEIGSYPLGPHLNSSYSNFSFEFEAFINDPTFRNEDNPYASFKLHWFTNMKDS